MVINYERLMIGLPWQSNGWESVSQCREHGFYPGSGQVPHGPGQLRPWVSAWQAITMRSLCTATREYPPLATSREACMSQGRPSTAAAKALQSCLTLCDPVDGSPPGCPVPGILQARTLEWVAVSVSNAWEWKVKVNSLSRVRLSTTPWTAAHQAPPSMGFSRQEHWHSKNQITKILKINKQNFKETMIK